MQLWLDDTRREIPPAATLDELLEGAAPWLDPGRILTHVDVDGRAADATDREALARHRLRGTEVVRVTTERPADFVASRRLDVPVHLRRIADRLSLVARGLAAGEHVADANRVLAAAAHELGLVLELDRQLAAFDRGGSQCEAVAEVVRRVGPQLNDAERGRRWAEVARLLADDLVPALRAGA